jgi:TfoX/Sxy family transcriptional regulator of competence genes
MDVADRFDAVVHAFARKRRVTTGRMFGSTGLKTDGKTFAMLVKDRLVVKLPSERVEELMQAGEGDRFDLGHGRLMREWVAIDPAARADWLELAREAEAFVRPPSG